jgi:hypothetical protein
MGKMLLSIGLLYWIYQSGKLNKENILDGLTNWPLAISFLILTFLQLLLGAKRTQVLVQFKSQEKGKLSDVTKISWASSFVCIATPISFVGDVFRISSLMKLDSSTNKDNAFYASLYSKIFSALSLMVISVFSSLFITRELLGIQDLRLYSLGLIISSVIIFVGRKKIIRLLFPFISRQANKISRDFLRTRVLNLLEYNYDFFKSAKQTVIILGYSLLIQVLNCISMFMIIHSITPDLGVSPVELFSIIPLGIFAQTLPISYSGLGVGHVVFEKLLSIYGVTTGADVFTIYFTLSFIFNLLGIIPFYTMMKSVSPETVKQSS